MTIDELTDANERSPSLGVSTATRRRQLTSSRITEMNLGLTLDLVSSVEVAAEEEAAADVAAPVCALGRSLTPGRRSNATHLFARWIAVT